MKQHSSVSVLLSIIFLILLSSCEKDNEDTTSKNDHLIKELIIKKYKPDAATQSIQDLKYDNQNRLIQFGLETFQYGDNGKVVTSRIQPESNSKANSPDFVRQLSYHWDTQNRLVEILLDTLYNGYTDFKDIVPVKRPVIARFDYIGNSTNPSKITWLNISLFDFLYTPVLITSRTNEISYTYEGNNILKSSKIEFEFPFISDNQNKIYSLAFKKYSDKPHFLYNLYKQLGFNPINIYEVIPANQEDLQYSVASRQLIPSDHKVDWEQSSKYEVQYDSNSRPTSIFWNPYRDLDNVHINDEYLIWSTQYQLKY